MNKPFKKTAAKPAIKVEKNEDLRTYFETISNNKNNNELLITLPTSTDTSDFVDGGEYFYYQPADNQSISSTITKSEVVNEDDMEFIIVVNKDSSDDLEEQQTAQILNDDEIYEFDENEVLVKANETQQKVQIPKNIAKLKANKKTSTDTADAASFSCTQCDYTIDKRHKLATHMKKHSDDRPYKCRVCERGFKTNSSLNNHLNTHLGKKPYKCEYCEKCFTTSGEVLRHTRYLHTIVKPHKCTECDYASVELTKLRRHMRCHTGERPYQCPHCTYASPDTFKLKRHLRTHTGEKPYHCDICDSRFTQSNSLKAHRLIHSVGDKPVFQCNFCPTTCGRKTDLRSHIQNLHHSAEPIKCKRCSMELPDRYSYKMHMKSHQGEKCFRCTICPYASVLQVHLDSHMLLHTNEKPFKCDHCELSFRRRQLLRRHINLYHNQEYIPPAPREKVHSCPHCYRNFAHKGNLMRHMETHDPDTSKEADKIKLKVGRLTRLQPDNSGTENDNAFDDSISVQNYADYNEENYIDDVEVLDEVSIDEMSREIIETLDQEDGNIIRNATEEEEIQFDIERNSSRNVIKNEKANKEYMTVAVDGEDGEICMFVEVVSCEEDDDQDDSTMAIETVNEDENNSLTENNDIKDCFGFDDDDAICEYEEDNKECIELLNIQVD